LDWENISNLPLNGTSPPFSQNSKIINYFKTIEEEYFMITYTDILFEGKKPQIDEKVFIAQGAHVLGKVTIGEFSSVWYNAIVRGDVNEIKIGRYTNIQDNAVVHVADNHPAIIGDYVTVGHNATVHACTVEDHCLIGMGSTVLDGAVIGRGSIVAAGAVVSPRTIVPPFSLVVGVPGKIIKTLPENTDSTHAQAVKYKTLWAERYGLLPNNDGEKYHGEKIVTSSKDK
jgi:carbonic anhydrase/acetyltransferase-like protein (isoleucine patch superfamily)